MRRRRQHGHGDCPPPRQERQHRDALTIAAIHAHFQLAFGGLWRMQRNLAYVLAHLEIERQLAHGGGDARDARQVRLREDPAGIEDVHVENGALAFARRIVFEAQRQLVRAALQLVVAAALRDARLNVRRGADIGTRAERSLR